jgi:hypothetical protein
VPQSFTYTPSIDAVSLPDRDGGIETNPCVAAAMVGYFLPRRSKMKHCDKCVGCSIRNTAR